MSPVKVKVAATIGVCGVLALVVSFALVLGHASTTGDLVFLTCLNMAGYMVFFGASVIMVILARRRWGIVEPIAGSFLAVSIVLYLGWGPLFREVTGSHVLGYLLIPVWATLATAPGMALGWVASFGILRPAERRRERIRAGLCQSCGYSRSGLAKDALCPECGGVADSSR